MSTFTYPVDVTEDEDGGFLAGLPDWDHVTQGNTRDEALTMAEDMLLTLLSAHIAERLDIPAPSAAAGRPVVAPGPGVAAKANLYLVWRNAAISKAELGRRLGAGPQVVARLFDPRHASRIEEIEKAMRALGKTLVVDVRDAA
ncbi:MAG: type II toxin-antitoxin system HicB family antitoxin [Alphaproteobacteria bacterium]|nr:type II toxin-antitoxin system HicB family antitoxin [Alphaproteobacteria bacterium]